MLGYLLVVSVVFGCKVKVGARRTAFGVTLAAT